MRRFAQYAAARPQLIVTPEVVQILNTSSQNLFTHIYIGREFNESGVVPRLGPDVPQWYGETIGFWDNDTLITWTSNILGWIAHGAHEYSHKLQTVEIYSPRKNEAGEFTGIEHEAVLYDPEALVEPVRIVQYWAKTGALNEGEPYPFLYCVQQNFPVNGFTTPMSSGHDVRVHGARYLRAALGSDLGEVSRARYAAAEERKPLRALMMRSAPCRCA